MKTLVQAPRKCSGCGRQLHRRPNESNSSWKIRKYCKGPCYRATDFCRRGWKAWQ